ncbi:hypothetical protein FACS1894204_11960 [Synergistales bacterium]|nr:hypothetical protein FACS1894204_11960 [Synergistales bacterium]
MGNGLRYSVGIDPGATGAIVGIVINPDKSYSLGCVTDIKDLGKPHRMCKDGSTYLEIFRELLDYMTDGSYMSFHVAIEKQQYLPKFGRQGGKSAFSLGQNYGYLRGLLAANEYINEVVDEVSPKTWQSVIYGAGGAYIEDTKKRSIAFCKKLLPELQTTGARGGLLHGRSDAALIALYAARGLWK